MLLNVLGSHRATLGLKCAGLEGGLARLSVEPATLSLLGLIRYGVGSGRAPGARSRNLRIRSFLSFAAR
ncbi:MAG: hypothetical protein K0R62_7293 [Nonomuraea muscovyensis]|nr:hypothetical protein [Nonomuraea muscovyensis]